MYPLNGVIPSLNYQESYGFHHATREEWTYPSSPMFLSVCKLTLLDNFYLRCHPYPDMLMPKWLSFPRKFASVLLRQETNGEVGKDSPDLTTNLLTELIQQKAQTMACPPNNARMRVSFPPLHISSYSFSCWFIIYNFIVSTWKYLT